MYERILIPLDGSKTGEAALPYVEEMLSKLSPEAKVEVTLFQVLSGITHYIVGGEAGIDVAYSEEDMKQTTEKAMDYLNKAGEALRSKGALVTAKVGIGSAAEEIVKAADEIKADLIAMSTHGRTGLSRWAFGSVADKVLRHGGNVPILMVKATS
ncbi:universal stress protein [Chloroflexota bacterium]